MGNLYRFSSVLGYAHIFPKYNFAFPLRQMSTDQYVIPKILLKPE